jgi:hypothetical protein
MELTHTLFLCDDEANAATSSGRAEDPVETGVCRNVAHFLPRFACSTTRGAFAVSRPPHVAREARLAGVWQAPDLLEHGYHVLNVAGPGPRHGPGQLLEPSNRSGVSNCCCGRAWAMGRRTRR